MLTLDEAMWLEKVAKSCTTEAQIKNWMAFVRKKMHGAEHWSLAHLQCERILRHSASYWLHDWGVTLHHPLLCLHHLHQLGLEKDTIESKFR